MVLILHTLPLPTLKIKARSCDGSALPQPQLTASFDPTTTGRYSNTNMHFRQNVLNSVEDEFNDQLRAHSHDIHGLLFCNLVNNSHQLVTETFSKTVTAHRGMQPVPHGRKFSTPMASGTPLTNIPGSPSSQTMETYESLVTPNNSPTSTSKTVTTSFASSGPQTVGTLS